MTQNIKEIRSGLSTTRVDLRDQAANPSAPPSGQTQVFSQDGRVYKQTPDGSVQEIGAGQGYARNYLQDFFNADAAVTVANGGVSATGNRSASNTVWASPNTANFSFSRVTSPVGRGQYSYQTSGAASGAAAFVESPIFNLDLADLEGVGTTNSRYLATVLEAYLTGASATFEISLVLYTSANVFVSETSFGTFSTSTVVAFPVSFINSLIALNTTNRVALRIRRTTGTGQLVWDRLGVTPDQPWTNGRQTVAGQKVFQKGVQTRNAEVITDVETTDVIPAGETRLAGRLVVPAGKTLQVDGDLTVVGAITGTGVLTGSGVITSV